VKPVPFLPDPAYNTRIETANALSGSSGVWGIGVWGTFIWGASNPSSVKDARLVNCMIVVEGGKRYIVKRPGLGVNSTPASGSVGNAIMVWAGQGSGTKVISAFGSTNSTIYDGTSSLGTITGKATGIEQLDVVGTPTLFITSSDNTAWLYDTTNGLVKVSDGDYPGNAGETVVGVGKALNGYVSVLTQSGKIYSSDLNSGSSWTSTSFDSTNDQPDNGVGLARWRAYIAAFGTNSVEFWKVAGNAVGSPLSRVQSMTQKVGAISADCIADISDFLFFVGSTEKGGLQVLQYDGGITPISNPEINNQLMLAGPNNISIATARFYGRSFVLVTASSSTFTYCLEEKRWHEWSGSANLWYKFAGLSSGSNVLTYAISKTSTSGKVYLINPANFVFTDDGQPFTASVQTDKMSAGGHDMFFVDVYVDYDRQSTSSTLTLSASDDDYQTFSTVTTWDMSNRPQRRVRIGSSPERAWKLTNSDATPMRLRYDTSVMNIGTGA